MTKIEKSVVIGESLEKVYAFSMDWRNLTRYMDYIHEVKPLTEKTIGEGSRLALRVRFMGMMMNCEWEGSEHIENVGWTFSGVLIGTKAVKTWRFAPEDGSTRVTFTLEYQPRINLIDRLLIKPWWVKEYERAFQNLRRLIEAETAKTTD